MYTFTTLIVGEIVWGGAKAKGNVQTKRSIYIKEKNIIRARTLQGETHVRAIKQFVKMLC